MSASATQGSHKETYMYRTHLVCFQARDHKRNLDLSCFSLFWVIVFLYICVPDACIVVNVVIRISLGLLYIPVVVSPGFDFVFSVLIKRLAGKRISKMTYFVSSGMQNPNQ